MLISMHLGLGADIWSGSAEGTGVSKRETEHVSHYCSSLQEDKHNKYCTLQSSLENCEAQDGTSRSKSGSPLKINIFQATELNSWGVARSGRGLGPGDLIDLQRLLSGCCLPSGRRCQDASAQA